jgi:hypothetical protein
VVSLAPARSLIVFLLSTFSSICLLVWSSKISRMSRRRQAQKALGGICQQPQRATAAGSIHELFLRECDHSTRLYQLNSIHRGSPASLRFGSIPPNIQYPTLSLWLESIHPRLVNIHCLPRNPTPILSADSISTLSVPRSSRSTFTIRRCEGQSTIVYTKRRTTRVAPGQEG